MGCKYVKDFKFDSANGYTGSTGKTEVKAYMRGGAVRKAPLDAAVPKQTPTDMRPLRTANAKTAMKEATQKRVSGASGKISTAGQYAKGGMACATGCQVEMKKGGKSKKADKKAPAKKPAARRNDKQSDAMAEQVLMQMLAQASQTGSMPGVPMQGMSMPAPGARAVPTASQAPMLPMKSGGMSRGQQAKVGRVMGEYKRGDLHSGSKSGPVVKNRDQAVAIAMSEARKKRA
jgi:hypothetical protein